MPYNSFKSGYYSADEINRSMIHCFLWMTIGLLVTGAVSAFLYSSGFFYSMMRMPMIPLILVIVQFGIVIAMSAGIYRYTESTLKILFMVYAATLGVSLTSIFYVYSLGTIFVAFGVSAFYFLCLALVGLTTKRDLTKLGTLCMVALLALVVSSVFMLLFRVPTNTILYSVLGLLIFTGITMWDVQRMPQILSQGNEMTAGKLSIFLAFDLYLDFINIFLYILRLVGNNSSRQ